MELEDVTLEQVKAFMDSLTVERRYLPLPVDYVRRAEYIHGIWLDGQLAAISGLARSRRPRLFPLRFSFMIVKSDFQRRGLSYKLMERKCEWARGKGLSHFIALSYKANVARRELAHRGNRQIFYDSGEVYWMIIALNRRGEALAILLRIVMLGLAPLLRCGRRLRHGKDETLL